MSLNLVKCDVRKLKIANANVDGIGRSRIQFDHFKVGEGGWEMVEGTRVPKTPDPSLTDLESVGSGSQFTFQKSFASGDLTVTPGGVTEVTCALDTNEPGLDGEGLLDGSDPHLYEIAIFDLDGDIVIYGTFNEVIKTAGDPVEFKIDIN